VCKEEVQLSGGHKVINKTLSSVSNIN
jgi:hypothetical protein